MKPSDPGATAPLPPVAVSACLLGHAVRWDGGGKNDDAVHAALHGRTALPLCPEMLAGLGCPRPPMAFVAGDGDDVVAGTGRLVDDRGVDRGPELVAGARRAVAEAVAAGVREAILKERSPSCGVHQIHRRSGASAAPGPVATQIVAGRGVFARLLRDAGIAVRSEEDVARGAR